MSAGGLPAANDESGGEMSMSGHSYSPREIAGSGADYVKLIASSVDAAVLQQALEIARCGNRKIYSKTLIMTLEREIRRKTRQAATK
jgi:hypothetical protein